MELRVLIIDGHPAVRRGLAALLGAMRSAIWGGSQDVDSSDVKARTAVASVSLGRGSMSSPRGAVAEEVPSR